MHADEVTSIEVSPALLRKGRPAKGTPSAGKTPALTIRLPGVVRREVDSRAEAGWSDSASELIRLALIEYFDNHPATR